MEKTMTTNEIVDLYTALDEFAKKDVSLSAQVAWNIEDNFEALKKIFDRFDKHRNDILGPLNEKNAFTQDEGTNTIRVKEGFEKEAAEAINKLNEYLAIENTISVKTISRDDLPDELSIKDLRALKFMIAE